MNRARSLVGREMNRSYSPEHFAISGTDEAKVAATRRIARVWFTRKQRCRGSLLQNKTSGDTARVAGECSRTGGVRGALDVAPLTRGVLELVRSWRERGTLLVPVAERVFR